MKSDQKKTAYAKFKKRLLRKVPKFRFLKMLTGSKIRIKWYFVTKIVAKIVTKIVTKIVVKIVTKIAQTFREKNMFY